MAKRFTDTELWDKEWFMVLKPRLKCLVKLVRDKCDLSGIWSPNWVIANAYVGEAVSEADLLSIDSGRQFLKMASGKILVVDFIEFQYGALSEKSPVHRKIISMLASNGIDYKIGYKHPIEWVEEKEEEEDKEEDKEEEEEKEKESAFNFELFWDLYDKKVDRRACEKKWAKLKESEKEAIKLHVPKYKLSTPDKTYRKNPETYLNNRSWENEVIQKQQEAKITELSIADRQKMAREQATESIIKKVENAISQNQ